MAIFARRVVWPSLAVAVVLLLWGPGCTSPSVPTNPAPAGDYLFCFWNVENLFDDRLDGRTGADEEYDAWFARDPAALSLKLTHLGDALLALNDGRGPDILAIAEVESVRAAELLREALNRRLPEALHYQHVLMKEINNGRHIAPALLTRLPVRADRTRLHGRRDRILEGRVVVHNHELVVLAAHWTSRVTDETGVRRAQYADACYGAYKAMATSSPDVDFLCCGDFNDPPDAPSVVSHLRAGVDHNGVVGLHNLFAGKEPEAGFGTLFHAGKWHIFDQIAVSPGLARDPGGWICDPQTVQTVNTLYRPGDRKKRPWRFGNPRDRFERGYSDHFPVTVRLRVQEP